MHCCRKSVVRRLAHIDVVIRVKQTRNVCVWREKSTGFEPCRNLVGAVCNNLVCVHVALCAGTSLPHYKRKMVVKRTGNNLVAGGAYGSKFFARHFLRLKHVVCHSSRFFKNSESLCYFSRHGLDAHTDFKVFVAALCLRRPVFISRNLHLSH